MNSYGAERMIDSALQEAGFVVSKGMFPVHLTRSLLQGDEYFEARSERCLAGYRKEMRRPNISWSDFTQAMLQDRVIGVDTFFSFEDKGATCLLGVDITVDKSKLDKKAYHLSKMRPALSQLGVSGCIVLLVEYGGDAGWQGLDSGQKEYFIDEIYNMVEEWQKAKSWLLKYTIAL